MKTLFDMVQKWMLSGGMGEVAADTAAKLICIAALVAAAAAFCGGFVFAVQRLLASRVKSAQHQEKLADFFGNAKRFVFAWILSENLPDILASNPGIADMAARMLNVAAVAFCAAALSSAVTCFRSVAKTRSEGRMFASKTFSQMLKILIWFTASIVVVSALMGKSPAFVLSGLGALTAVLMLIFKDSLLGLVAGVQVSQNDMVRVGDWITMSRYNADGNVIDIALTTVKVRNFDNTVTMIPSSALISDAFVNWRYMSTSKGRRIKRPVWISVTSVRRLTDDQIASLIADELLQNGDRPVSNLAAFETWLRRMLDKDERISRELTCMVRQTEAGDTGIPVEVYAFTKTRDWEEYEMIQTDIFDRIFVTVPRFGLQVYQRTGDKTVQQ
jgi:miniconductance mechanosensitive channel